MEVTSNCIVASVILMPLSLLLALSPGICLSHNIGMHAKCLIQIQWLVVAILIQRRWPCSQSNCHIYLVTMFPVIVGTYWLAQFVS